MYIVVQQTQHTMHRITGLFAADAAYSDNPVMLNDAQFSFDKTQV